ncbi:MAG: DUF1566 domain-containing protein [Gammaproteobacteria bacterium]|nr:DUF1566 domain-containing protein [Gammaproteobacteria bacterium]
MHPRQRKFIAAVTLGATIAVPGLSLGALIDRGGGLIYDTDLDITWLADANYAATSGYDADGMMTYSEANAWVNQLSFGGFDDWRLPFNPQLDASCSLTRNVNGITLNAGFDCQGSEYGHLFYSELGGTTGSPITDSTDPDVALFSNIMTYVPSTLGALGEYWAAAAVYWSPDLQSNYTIYHHFHFSDGYQRDFDPTIAMHAMAVRDGDVAAVVPVPGAVWLFMSGLMGLMGAAKRKTAV